MAKINVFFHSQPKDISIKIRFFGTFGIKYICHWSVWSLAEDVDMKKKKVMKKETGRCFKLKRLTDFRLQVS